MINRLKNSLIRAMQPKDKPPENTEVATALVNLAVGTKIKITKTGKVYIIKEITEEGGKRVFEFGDLSLNESALAERLVDGRISLGEQATAPALPPEEVPTEETPPETLKPVGVPRPEAPRPTEAAASVKRNEAQENLEEFPPRVEKTVRVSQESYHAAIAEELSQIRLAEGEAAIVMLRPPVSDFSDTDGGITFSFGPEGAEEAKRSILKEAERIKNTRLFLPGPFDSEYYICILRENQYDSLLDHQHPVINKARDPNTIIAIKRLRRGLREREGKEGEEPTEATPVAPESMPAPVWTAEKERALATLNETIATQGEIIERAAQRLAELEAELEALEAKERVGVEKEVDEAKLGEPEVSQPLEATPGSSEPAKTPEIREGHKPYLLFQGQREGVFLFEETDNFTAYTFDGQNLKLNPEAVFQRDMERIVPGTTKDNFKSAPPIELKKRENGLWEYTLGQTPEPKASQPPEVVQVAPAPEPEESHIPETLTSQEKFNVGVNLSAEGSLLFVEPSVWGDGPDWSMLLASANMGRAEVIVNPEYVFTLTSNWVIDSGLFELEGPEGQGTYETMSPATIEWRGEGQLPVIVKKGKVRIKGS